MFRELGESRWTAVLGAVTFGLLVIASALAGVPVRAGPPTAASARAESGRRSDTDTNTNTNTEANTTDELARERSRLVWQPASVAWPLAPLADPASTVGEQLDHRLALIEGRADAPSVRGVVDVDPERAVGVWIAALETVRVRQFGEAVPLRFVRAVDGRTAVIEPGRAVAPGPGGERRWELEQPPSTGAVWTIEADAPSVILIERIRPRSPRYVAVEVEDEVLDWIAAGEDPAALPALLEPATEVRAELLLDAALERALLDLGPTDARLERALSAWRMLGAFAALDRKRAAVRPYHARDPETQRPLALDGTKAMVLGEVESRGYRLAETPRRWTIARTGPGQLRIAARTWAPKGSELSPAELRVHAGGRVIARLVLSPRPARHALDPDTALPQLVPLETKAGDPVGEFARETLVLAPGDHEYELELLGGPALIAVEGTRRIEPSLASMQGRTPRKRAKAATRALAKSKAEAAPWLEQLLAARTLDGPAGGVWETSDPRFDAVAEASPLLATVALALAAEHIDPRDVDGPARVDALVARIQPWLAALDRDSNLDPSVRGAVRTTWLRLLALHDRGALVDVLLDPNPGGADPLTELDLEGLRLAAELLGPRVRPGIERASALALLDLAKAKAPADEALREQILRTWSSISRWSLQLPTSTEAGPLALAAAGEWLVSSPLSARAEGDDADIDFSSRWLELAMGVPARVHAKVGASLPGPAEGPAAARDTSGEGPRRVRLADVLIASAPGAVAPVELRVDDRRWWSPQLFGVQRHRVAVSPGDHEIAVDGPPGTRAWSRLGPSPTTPETPYARRERAWRLPGTVWELPGPAVPGMVRLRLRWPEDLPPRALTITIHEADAAGVVESRRQVILDPRIPGSPQLEIDDDSVPLPGTQRVSPQHDVAFSIAADTTKLWFEVEEDLGLLGAVAVRRGLRPGDRRPADAADISRPDPDEDAGPFAELDALDEAALLDELARLSAILLTEPDNLDARARRAALLLAVGQTGLARADLSSLGDSLEDLHGSQRAHARALLVALRDHFDALIEPREALVYGPEDGPILIEPALAAVAGDARAELEPWLAVWSEVRDLNPDEALPLLDAALAAGAKEGLDPGALRIGAVARAHWLSEDPLRARDASRAWLELYGGSQGAPGTVREPIALGLAAAAPLLAHLDDPSSDARDAGLAYGLARELMTRYSHTTLRRLAFVSALRSAWTTVTHSEDNAGFETLALPVSAIEASANAAVREALLVAPWAKDSPPETQQLRPGRKAVLAWDAEPGRVRAELWCRILRPDLSPQGEPGPARVRVHVQAPNAAASDPDPAADAVELELSDGVLEAVTLPVARAGRHQLHIALDDDRAWLCAWRAHAEPAAASEAATAVPLTSYRRATWWTIDPKRGAEFVILGPASVAIEGRAVIVPDPDQRMSTLIAEIGEPGPSRAHERGELGLDTRREGEIVTERRRRFNVTHARTHTVLLSEARPYRVRLASEQGRALVRVRVRRDRGDLAPPAQVSVREFLVEAPVQEERVNPGRGYGVDLRVEAADPPPPVRNRAGTFSVLIRVGLDEIDQLDDFFLRFGSSVRATWRRELLDNKLWIRVAAQVQVRERSPAAGGGLLGFGARVPVVGLRLGALVDALAHPFAGRPEASVRGSLFIDRPTWLGRFVQLLPALDLGLRWQSLTPDRVAAATTVLEPHPRVYLDYIHDHPFVLRPELGLRVYPLQDLALWSRASLTPNSDLRSLDQTNFSFGLDGIGRQPRVWVPTWGLSYEASLRFADADRDVFALRHRVDAELGVAAWASDAARVGFGVSNQVNVTVGEPIRDVIELWLRVDAALGRRMRDFGPTEMWFGELWAPRKWREDDHQARSTMGDLRRESN